jgi:hypothetical protein
VARRFSELSHVASKEKAASEAANYFLNSEDYEINGLPAQ